MNNAAYWEAAEEWLGAHRDFRAPLDAVVEHLEPVMPGHEVATIVEGDDTGPVTIWHESAGRIAATTVLRSTSTS